MITWSHQDDILGVYVVFNKGRMVIPGTGDSEGVRSVSCFGWLWAPG